MEHNPITRTAAHASPSTSSSTSPITSPITLPTAPSSTVPEVGNDLEPAFSLKELALLFNVSIQALYDLRSQGRGPTGFRVGRQLRFRQSEVHAWLERMEAEDLDRHPRTGSR